MKLWIIVCLVFASKTVSGQWASRVFVEEAVTYFDKVVQETFFELEKLGFCNLKLNDVTQTISEQMYKWLVAGNITYTNGFVVSIQKIDVTGVQQQTLLRTVDGVVYTVAAVQGNVNLRDMKIGYDVIAELGEDGDHRFTGTFVHTLTTINFSIQKTLNMNTQEIVVAQSLNSLSGGLNRMIYMPANNITQVISRTYISGLVWDGITSWRDVIVPIMTDIVTNKIAFPPVCLDCR